MELIEIEFGKKIELDHPIAACIGYFDGFHVGHQGLFQATLKAAKEQELKSAIITFDPDPWTVIKGMSDIAHLSSLQDRALWALEDGFDYFIVMKFTKVLSDLSETAFVEDMLLPLQLKYLVCGFDFRFGHRGSGTVTSLRLLSKDRFVVEEISEIMYENAKISSTRISKEVELGNMNLVTNLLSRPYQMQGYVIPGRQQGRKIGFPTANIKLTDLYIQPKAGVYAGEVVYDGQVYLGMMNIGYNPTFNTRESISIEVNILDFEKMIYGETIILKFHQYLREEIKYDSIEELIVQLHQDVIDTRTYFVTDPFLQKGTKDS